MPTGSQVGGVDVLGLVYLAAVLAVVFLPMILSRRGSPPDQSDSDSHEGGEGGGGGRPWPPRPPADTPGGGIPLADAQPARARLRGHDRLFDLLPARARRPAREPDRRPVRTP
jgi:hypothetical protein